MPTEVLKKQAETFREWREQELAAIEGSKYRLSEQTGIPRSHPKFERAYEIAWQERHSMGLYEVEDLFAELADLLRP